VGRLRLGLGSRPHVVGRLGYGVRVSVSFQIFVLIAGGNVLGAEGNSPGGENVRGNMPEAGMSRRNVVHSKVHTWSRKEHDLDGSRVVVTVAVVVVIRCVADHVVADEIAQRRDVRQLAAGDVRRRTQVQLS